MKLMCFLCERNFSDLDELDQLKKMRKMRLNLVKANGEVERHEGQICQECQSLLWCDGHQNYHVVFIDFTHVCFWCVLAEAEIRLRNKRDELHSQFRTFIKVFPVSQRKRFYNLVRKAVDESGGPASSSLLCFLVAVISKTRGWQKSPLEILEEVKQSHNLLNLLPQASKRYHYKIKV